MKGQRDPMEALSANQAKAKSAWVTGALLSQDADWLIARGRLAHLMCGHYVLTRALYKAACPRCGEMIRSGWDYEGFRRAGSRDTFSWPDDPLRQLHETDEDGEGRFDPTSPR
ncbi:hypothetical protein ABIC83_002954 [Roseateles asaccharophilus]|uniref:hypothetical protein n=1 Tax=Roseateles asaccharophilus TaxID=582607 RepID=UPI003832BF8C